MREIIVEIKLTTDDDAHGDEVKSDIEDCLNNQLFEAGSKLRWLTGRVVVNRKLFPSDGIFPSGKRHN